MRAIAAGCACAMLSACGRFGFDGTVAPDGDPPIFDAVPPGDSDASGLDAPLATIEFVQTQSMNFGSPATGALTVAFAADATAGDTVVIAIDCDGAGTTLDSITDDLGTSFAIVPPFDGNSFRQFIAYGHLDASGPDSIHVTRGGTVPSFFEVRLHEYTGIAADGFDGAASATGTSLEVDGARSDPVTAPVAGELIFGVAIFLGQGIAGTEFTTRSTAFGDVTEDRLAPAPGPYAAVATMTTGSFWLSTAAAFRPAPL